MACEHGGSDSLVESLEKSTFEVTDSDSLMEVTSRGYNLIIGRVVLPVFVQMFATHISPSFPLMTPSITAYFLECHRVSTLHHQPSPVEYYFTNLHQPSSTANLHHQPSPELVPLLSSLLQIQLQILDHQGHLLQPCDKKVRQFFCRTTDELVLKALGP